MTDDSADDELLLRYVDDRTTGEERLRVSEMLRTDPRARAFLRDVAEQAVMVADIERTALSRQVALEASPHRSAPPKRTLIFGAWPWGMAAAAAVALIIMLSVQVSARSKAEILRVSKAAGASQYFGSNGKTETDLSAGVTLGAGDTLETRSCDAWIELALRDGSTLTIAGNSTLRVLSAEQDQNRFKLVSGNLWVSPARGRDGRSVVVQTQAATVETRDAQFDVQASANDMILRVNAGSARLTHVLDGSAVDVPADHQVITSIGKKEPLAIVPRPRPIESWSCDLTRAPEVILGDWLPPRADGHARLGAEPLLWPVPGQKPVMLYAVALAAWKSSDGPVLLRSDSKLLIRGRTERAKTVRFGFSAQRMRGVFAGKFEVDVPPASLGRPGEAWQVELPLSDFRPLHPQLAASPTGLELTDVYALTINEDAGLEIKHVELRSIRP